MPVTPPTNPPGATTAQTYADAVKLSGEQGRPVLVMFTADWCSWCQKMKNNVLPDPTVAAMMKNYIYVAVNTDQNAELTKKYGISGIPAFLITNGKEDKLKFIASYMEPNAFVTWLNDSSLFNQPKLDKPATPPTTPKPPSTPDDKPKKPKRPKK
jgi:putative thioredoxin